MTRTATTAEMADVRTPIDCQTARTRDVATADLAGGAGFGGFAQKMPRSTVPGAERGYTQQAAVPGRPAVSLADRASIAQDSAPPDFAVHPGGAIGN